MPYHHHGRCTYPHIRLNIDLSGDDGGVHVIVAKVKTSLRKGGVPEPAVQVFVAEIAACHSYTAVLAVISRWVYFNEGVFMPHQKHWTK